MIVVDHAGPVARLTLNRPAARNAIDLDSIEAMMNALDTLEAAPGLRVVVITGEGERVFCSGADLAALAGNPGARRAAGRRYGELLARIAAFPRPTVARLNGACVAGGMGLLLACDLAVAAPHATLSLPEGNVGMWPMLVGALLRRAVGERIALDLALTARKLDATEALRLGLVNRVAGDAGLDAELDGLLATLVRQSPSAHRIGRKAWRDAHDLPLAEALDLLAVRLGDVMDTEDATEGFLAFLQKREPEWKDR